MLPLPVSRVRQSHVSRVDYGMPMLMKAWSSERRKARGSRRNVSRNPRSRAQAVRRLSRRVLAGARSRARLSDRVREGADRGGLPVGADPRGVWRVGPGPAARRAILEEIHRSGCNGAACHAQMYTMGTLLRHGSEAQKQVPAEDRLRRAAAAGVRRHRADAAAPTPRASAPSPGATATTTSSTARRSGSAAPSIPT